MAGARALIAALHREATASDDPERLVALVADGLVASGLPLWRLSVGVRAIDPEVRALSFVWRRGGGLTAQTTPYRPGDNDIAYRRSPIFWLSERNLEAWRWRLDHGEGCDELPLLAELRAEGATEYAMHLVRFAGATAAALPGVALAFATDQPDGFREPDRALVAEIVPPLGLAIFRFALARTLAATLDVYLGPKTARRVLAGEAHRGTGRATAAALLLADLRGFTALSARADPQRVVAWLDQHLGAIGTAVAASDGEVLKFLGDGLLAVWPVDELEVSEHEACARALQAAEAALATTAELNASRRATGEPELDLDVVLHFGEVVYGNVGAARRLDFTVIGPTVNEASRMEALCAELRRQLLLSGAFAARCGRATVSLGRFRLRGCEGKTEVLAPVSGHPPTQA